MNSFKFREYFWCTQYTTEHQETVTGERWITYTLNYIHMYTKMIKNNIVQSRSFVLFK